MKIAVFTMVYNESKNLPIWMKYYGKHFGEGNCFIIDHGSTDGSTDNLGRFNVTRIPRSPQDDQRRAVFISELVNAYLTYFDLIIYVDCDEIIAADPRKFKSIQEYCQKVKPKYITSIGLDLLHKLNLELPLDLNAPILNQRSFVHYSSAMNKPNISAIRTLWSQGFHSREVPCQFGDIYLFHLRYADLDRALGRLDVTRQMPWAHEGAGSHQKISAEVMTSWIENWGKLPVLEGDPLAYDKGRLAEYVADFKKLETKEADATTYSVDTNIFGKELIRIPAAFRDLF